MSAKRKKAVEETTGPVTLTKAAIEQINLATKREQPKGKGLRALLVQDPGGFRYDIQIEDKESPGDHVSVQGGIKVFVDRTASQHLAGTVIDFVSTSPEWGGFLFTPKNAS